MSLCNSANANLPYGTRKKPPCPPPPPTCFHHSSGSAGLELYVPLVFTDFPFVLTATPSSSHEVAHSRMVQERSTGIPLASALGGPLCPPASRLGATVPLQTPLPPLPRTQPAGERPCPYFPLLRVPGARRALDPPAHRRPRSPLASGGRPSPDPGRGGWPQGGSPLYP